MRSLRRKRIVHWFTLCALLVLASGCNRQSSDEQRLRQAVAAMQTAAEARELRPILDYLAEDFQGNGRYRKANIGGMLLLQFRQNRHVHIYLRITGLRVTGDRATIRCRAILAGRDEKIVPERARVLEINSEWQRRDGEWRVHKATWDDALDQS
jgi:hypothetical protein